jgi:twitching motility protein PilT
MNIRSVLDKMIAAHASDLHLKAGTPPVVRVDGVLYTLDEPPPSSAELREVSNQLLNEEQRQYFSTHSEIDFAFGVSGLARFRANIFMQRGTPALALRHVPVEVPSIEDLSLPAVVRELAFSPRGLILVTGRTGSGKSTTLAAMIDAINKVTTRNVITVEDPIEFLHRDRMSLVHQRSRTRHALVPRRPALRSAPDPDIIPMVDSRSRDHEHGADGRHTGHLIMSTLHTTTSPRPCSASFVLSAAPARRDPPVDLFKSARGRLAAAHPAQTAPGECRR